MSLLAQETICAGSVQFPVDNSEFSGVEWACEGACDGPTGTIGPVGMLEVKAETLRAVICSTTDLLEDASFNVEGWVMRKAQRAVRQKLAAAFICGDGVGTPVGILNSAAGIPICETSPSSPPGEFRWQDLVALQFELPEEYASNAVYLMNARTLGMVMTISDASGRPLWMQTPATDAGGRGGFMIVGKPVRIVSQMPTVAPGATPVIFGDLEQLYLVVMRRSLSMQPDRIAWASV